MRKVRVNSLYRYNPVLMDIITPPYKYIKKGEVVRVINKYGCPKANTMGHCYVEDMKGDFLGLVCTNSLDNIR